MRVSTCLIALSFTLATGCASQQKPPEEEDVSATEVAVERSQAGFGDAAMTPLEDLNLKRDKIPEPLKQIENPYRVSENISCRAIAEEVEVLNGILGRDWDVPPPGKKSLSERAGEGASTAFLDAVSSGAGGIIPFRGVVRSVTGASSHQKKVLRAYERGSHRRTFLKAIGKMKGCDSPAAPLPLPKLEPKVVFRD